MHTILSWTPTITSSMTKPRLHMRCGFTLARQTGPLYFIDVQRFNMASNEKKNKEYRLNAVREGCLKRGACGIKSFGRTFRIFDDDRTQSLDKDEFIKGLTDYRIDLPPEEMGKLFDDFDTDGSGSVNFDEFLMHLRPPMSQSRKDIIKKAFDKMDRTGDGVVTMEDLKGVYNARKHPKYQNGEWTEAQVFKEYLKSFESSSHPDGKVTYEEFLNYYAGVSSSIDDDAYFDLMMRHSWKL